MDPDSKLDNLSLKPWNTSFEENLMAIEAFHSKERKEREAAHDAKTEKIYAESREEQRRREELYLAERENNNRKFEEEMARIGEEQRKEMERRQRALDDIARTSEARHAAYEQRMAEESRTRIWLMEKMGSFFDSMVRHLSGQPVMAQDRVSLPSQNGPDRQGRPDHMPALPPPYHS